MGTYGGAVVFIILTAGRSQRRSDMCLTLGRGNIGPIGALRGVDAGLIAEGKGLVGPLADIHVNFRRGRGQPPDKPCPGMTDREGYLSQAAVPGFQQGLHHSGVAAFLHIGDEGIPLQQDAAHRGQGGHIAGHHLADGAIQKRAALRGSLLDERQLPRREHHRQKFTGQLAGNTLHTIQPGQLFAAIGQCRSFLPVLAGKFRLNAGDLLPKAQIVAFLGRAEALLPGKQVDGLDEIGLALGVFAVNDINTGSRGHIHRRQVAEIFSFQPGEPHGAATCQLSPSRVTVSPGWSFLPRMVHTSPFTCTSPSAMAILASPPVPTAPQNLRKLSSLMNSVWMVMVSIWSRFLSYY